MPAGASVVRPAWAKINLFLEVTGRRADGYHELESLIVFAGLGDQLRLEAGESLELTVTGRHAAGVPTDDGNLVLAAARALRRAAGAHAGIPPETSGGARIRLDKRIPVAAGVGGGSADAAATLEGLRALWRLDLGDSDLRHLSVELGADVPVCLFGRPALVRGIGEVIDRAPPLPPAWLVLVNPGVSLATKDVFAARSGPLSRPRPWPSNVESAPENATELAEALRQRRNDLEPPAVGLAPVIERVLSDLAPLPGALLARMSGSGATCFALFASAKEAKRGAAELRERHADWWVAAAPLLHGKLTKPWRSDSKAAAG